MVDTSKMTVSEVITIIRNIGFLLAILGVGWKARALIQPIVDFFNDTKRLMKRSERHMDVMEESMVLLLDNHLAHIGKHVASVAHNQVRASSEEVAYYGTEDAALEAASNAPSDSSVTQV